ncbi:uncharacterized protein FYW47_000281 [Aplochiton taeniatus]
MDTSSVPLLNYNLQYQWSCPSSDSDLYSISSPETVSPVYSMDSSFSPAYYQTSESTPRGTKTGCSARLNPSEPGKKTGRSRSRIRSKQRESASEKEKLRMRDLTKALHHLRTYLPPSVAPAGQTLTKIETLRLTIRYISYLSAQLGLSEEVLFQKRESDSSVRETTSPDILGYFQCSPVTGQWTQGQSNTQAPVQCQSEVVPLNSGSCSSSVDLAQHFGQCSDLLQGDLFNSSMESFLQSPQALQTPSCQMNGKDFYSQLVPREYWG